MNANIPVEPLHAAFERLDEVLVATGVPEACRSVIQLAQDDIRRALIDGGAWRPGESFEWVARGSQCGHENTWLSEPAGNLAGSTCTTCNASLAGAVAAKRIRRVP